MALGWWVWFGRYGMVLCEGGGEEGDGYGMVRKDLCSLRKE